ncbi:MAG TPA: hypothetical protein VGP55_10945 [Chitinophagaceae bacterium]|nr:hypothetical protein [Chitinophagaceae bacterium]
MHKISIYISIFLTLIAFESKGQSSESLIPNAQNISSKYYSTVDKKISSINDRLTKKSIKYLKKLEGEDKKIQRALNKVDSTTTNSFVNTNELYDEFTQKLKKKTEIVSKLLGGQYNSYLDTLGTSLNFLNQINGLAGKIKSPLNGLNQLEKKLQQTEKIKAFIAERKEQIKQMLAKFTKLPAGLKKQYDQLNKTAYYYSAQIQEYKLMLKDPKRIEQKTIALLNKIPAFQKFMQQNSQLASLFRIPVNYGTAQNLTGLQTRSSVQVLVQQRIAMGGPTAQAQIQQNLAQAHAALNKIKDKLNQFGGGGSDVPIPDFKPNGQKTKTFLQRLELGSNLQFAKSNRIFPSTTEIGLSAGYKLNDKSILGIGLSYKMGLGTLRHIVFTSQGLGLRSFFDYKIKKQFFISGGYEMNYNAAFKNIEQLKNYNAWQRSGLIGLSKKYKVSKKLKGNMQILYDFLANTHVPVTQPFISRLGYNL